MTVEAEALEQLLAQATAIEQEAERKALLEQPIDAAQVPLAIKALSQRIDELNEEVVELKADLEEARAGGEPLQTPEDDEQHDLTADPVFDEGFDLAEGAEEVAEGEQPSVADPDDEADPEEKGVDFTDDDLDSIYGPGTEVVEDGTGTVVDDEGKALTYTSPDGQMEVKGDGSGHMGAVSWGQDGDDLAALMREREGLGA